MPTPRRVAKAEAALGFRLPEDLRASLLRHDGTETVLVQPGQAAVQSDASGW
ncbi:SMI1/KNR4 family protein [Nonomuraea dietziae]|uniref:SMI1/KNR4 family protein n=1 Tax=Nonomuraea dietziae TaxID=65515 RepID=UPI0034183B96